MQQREVTLRTLDTGQIEKQGKAVCCSPTLFIVILECIFRMALKIGVKCSDEDLNNMKFADEVRLNE